MSSEFLFSKEPGDVEGIVWSGEAEDDANLMSFNADNSESFVSAVEDQSSAYMTVLDGGSDSALSCLNDLTLEGKMEIPEVSEEVLHEEETVVEEEATGATSVEVDGQQVVVFSVEGSDDLYGIQMTEDEHGNIQRFQFKFRTTPEGHLEAIAESVQLLPEEEQVVEEPQEFEERPKHIQIFMNAEPEAPILPDNPESESENEEVMEEQEAYEEMVDTKPILDSKANIKQEEESQDNSAFQLYSEQHLKMDEEEQEEAYGEEEEEQYSQEEQEEYYEAQEEQQDFKQIEEESNDYQEIYIQDACPSDEYLEETAEETAAEEPEEEEEEVDEEEEEDYEVVDGLHITGDLEVPQVQQTPQVLQEVLEKSRVQDNLVKVLNNEALKTEPTKNVVYYIYSQPEKENVCLQQTKNPRSLLKTVVQPLLKPVVQPAPPPVIEKVQIPEPQIDERFNKRFSKNKQTIQARQFHNFINKTTIVQAPKRQERLPRKQQIKPVVDRGDAEITVQEMMYSSSGFVESKAKSQEPYVEYIDLTDSGDDITTKKKRQKRQSSSESEISIIEINSDDDEEQEATRKPPEKSEKKQTDSTEKSEKKQTDSTEKSEKKLTDSTLKRRRGRPRKSPSSDEFLPKKTRLEEEFARKKEIKCPHCTKTFPSENSLNTHIHHHNLENRLRTRRSARLNELKPTFEYKHKCEHCEETFKNALLLKRHAESHSFNCNLCTKTFLDEASLTTHKRSHIKQRLVSASSTVKISPKKFVSPKAPTKNLLKCKLCSKLCTNQTVLNLHLKEHEKFTCKSCNATFLSRLLLDTHLRTSCVKTKQPQNRRLSFRTRKSVVPSPKKVTVSTAVTRRSFALPQVTCELCHKDFRGYENLLRHKVSIHGEEAPDKKEIMNRKTPLATKKRQEKAKPYVGVPSTANLRKAYAGFQKVLLENA